MPLADGSIVGIHGIAQQQLGRHQLLASWSRALADGIERAIAGRSTPPPLDVAYFGDLFLVPAEGTKAGVETGGSWLDDLSDDESVELAAAVREMAVEEPGTELPNKGYTRAPALVQSAIRLLDRRFDRPEVLLCVGELRQVRRYLREPVLRQEVADRLTTTDRHGRVLIGHSLGSVVALDHLMRRPDRRYDLLLTLGSPLGLRFVRDRLTPAGGPAVRPGNVGRWVNVRDPRDPVAGVPLEGRWSGVQDVTVNNQSDAHAAERYLGKRQVGEAVVAALPELAR